MGVEFSVSLGNKAASKPAEQPKQESKPVTITVDPSRDADKTVAELTNGSSPTPAYQPVISGGPTPTPLGQNDNRSSLARSSFSGPSATLAFA